MSEQAPQNRNSQEQPPTDPRKHPDYVPITRDPDDAVQLEQILRSDGLLDGGWAMQGTLGQGKVYQKIEVIPGKEHEQGAVKWVSPEKLAERDRLLEDERRKTGASTIHAVQTAELMSAATTSDPAAEYVPLSADDLAERRRAAGMFTPEEIEAMQAPGSHDAGHDQGDDTADLDEPDSFRHLWNTGPETADFDVERAAVREPDPAAGERRRRAAMDAKYDEVLGATGNPVAAQDAADRVWNSNNF